MSKTITIISIGSILLTAIFISHYSQNGVQKARTENVDFLQITDQKPISQILKQEEILSTDPISEAPVMLKGFVKEFLCSQFKGECELDESTIKLNLSSVDLNSDGNKEYISMPNSDEGFLRGASGNGPIIVIQIVKDIPKVMVEMQGNGYMILNKRVNGYLTILSHNHSSAASGTETVYQMSKDTFGVEQYEYLDVFTKWYRQY